MGSFFNNDIIAMLLYTRERKRGKKKIVLDIMEKMRKLNIWVYLSSNTLSIISIFTAIIANYVLADEGYNSGGLTSLCAQVIISYSTSPYTHTHEK